MELQTAIEILEYHQEWRLGKREDMIHEPKKLTEALDIVLSEVKKFHLAAVIRSVCVGGFLNLKTNNMIDNQTLNKIIRKKIIWTEIKAKEQEYKRLQKQIKEIEQAQADISFEVQKKLQESQEIAEWLDQREYDALMRGEEKQTDV